MSQLRHAPGRTSRPIPDEPILSGTRTDKRQSAGLLRVVGALAVLVVGAVHLEQYLVVHFDVIPIIGPLFLLNFVGATLIGLGLLIPHARMRPLHLLLALGGIGLAATSFVFLFISEHQPLFGFQDYGYRTAIIVALSAEAAAVLSLSGYLLTRARHV